MSATREPGTVVTLGRVYAKLLEVERATIVIKEHVKGVREDVNDHGGRVAALERARWPLPSIGVLLAAGAMLMNFWGRSGDS